MILKYTHEKPPLIHICTRKTKFDVIWANINQNEEIDVCNGDMYALFKNIFCNLNNNHVKKCRWDR